MTLILPNQAIAQVDCPCTVFAPTDAPSGDAVQDQPLEVGMKWRSSEDGFITALRFYKQPSNTGRHVGHLWSASGQQLAEVEFTDESASGWQVEPLPVPVEISKDTTYVVSYHSGNGRYAATSGYFSSDVERGPLRASASGNGVFRYGASAFPQQTYNATNYWVDVTFESTLPPAPRISAVSPSDGARDVALTTNVTVAFEEPIDPETVSAASFKLRDPDDTAVAAAVSYDTETHTATLSPTTDLRYGTTYTATVKGGIGGVADGSGNPLAADRTWSFSTPPACPCTVFGPTDAPLGSSVDGQPLEIGMKLSSSEDGYITALRFHKPLGDTGRHVGHLWSSSGQMLAEVEFTDETSSGWQAERLPSPIEITKDTTYVASYHSSHGRYGHTSAYFSSEVGEGPLRAPALGNGVYRYGPSGFPDVSFDATNYWVDATFERARPPDTRAPRVVSSTPASDADGIERTTTITATFDEPLDPATVNSGTFVLENVQGEAVVGSVSYDASERRATFTPSAPLTPGTTYRATIKAESTGPADLAGNHLANDRSWTFETDRCPCTIFSPTDAPVSGEAAGGDPLEVGVRFRANDDGFITSLRYYKQPNNVGTHVGHLWSADGQLLATAPFVDETSSGWQQADLQNPIAINKDTTYVASYHSSAGYYASDRDGLSNGRDRPPLQAPAIGGNGVYRYGESGFPDQTYAASNYWVDVSFERVPSLLSPRNLTLPTISGTAERGAKLVVSRGTWNGNGPLVYGYQWLRCDASGQGCESIPGSRGARYTLDAADLERTIRVRVTARSGDTPASALSAPTTAIKEATPVNATAPMVFGDPSVGEQLTSSPGEWTPADPALEFTAQWQSCDAHGEHCANIAGATGTSYVLGAADAGSRLRVVVTAASAGGSTQASSSPTPLVTTPSVRNTGAPEITRGPGVDGDLLTVDPGAWDGEGSLTYRYHWQRCNDSGVACQTVATGVNAYSPNAADVGSRIKAIVIAKHADGSSAAASAPTQVITAAAPARAGAPTVIGEPRAGVLLGTEPGLWTGLGPLELEYAWQRCDPAGEHCTAIPEATESVYEPGTDEAGAALRVQVTAHNDSGSDTSVSAATAVVSATGTSEPPALAPGSAVSLSGAPVVGETLSADEGDWVHDGGDLDFKYEWERCAPAGQQCQAVGATGNTYLLGADDVAAFVRVTVVASDAAGTGFATAMTRRSVRAVAGPANTTAPSIGSSPREGLQAPGSPGGWTTTPPVTYAYQWQRCDPGDETGDCEDIEGATEPTYLPELDDIALALRLAVTATDTEGTTTALSDVTAPIAATTPYVTTEPTISGHARSGHTLTASAGTWDGESPIAHEYQWQSCAPNGEDCADILGAEAPTYTLGTGDVDARVRVVVTASNTAASTSEPSDLTAPIAASDAPTASSPPAISGTPQEREMLAATVGAWSGPEPIDFAYQWETCDGSDDVCLEIENATEPNYQPTADDVGAQLRVRITATNAAGATSVTSSLTVEVRAATDESAETARPRNLRAPAIIGDTHEGAILTADPGAWSAQPTAELSYQWRSCAPTGRECANIDGATESSYVVSAGDDGTTVRVVVTATNSAGATSVTSTPRTIGAPIKNLALPSVTGETMDGDHLTADPGTWNLPQLSLEYQWQRCSASGQDCADITGATTQDLRLDSAAVGSRVRILVTARDESNSTTAASLAGPMVAPRPPELAGGDPWLSETPMQNAAVTVHPNAWHGTPELTYSYQWRRCDEAGQDCSDIPTATTASYVPQASDVGSSLRAIVTVSNAVGTASADSGPSVPVLPASAPGIEGIPLIALDTAWNPPISQAPRPGETLAAHPGAWRGADPLTYEYQWKRCQSSGTQCENIALAVGDTYRVEAADLGTRIRVRVQATNSLGSASAESDATEPVATGPDVPVNLDPPTVAGIPEPGETLSPSLGSWGGNAQDWQVQWSRCDATGSNCAALGGSDWEYRVARADVGSTLMLTVTAENEHGASSADSPVTDVVSPAGPFGNLVPPSISPWEGPEYGRLFREAEPGEWSGGPEVTEQWQRCDPLTADPETGAMECTDIPGATHPAAEYKPTAEDVGFRLRLAETAHTDTETATVYTEPTYPVYMYTSLNDVGVSGVPVVGQTLTAHGQIQQDGTLPTTLRYEFLRETSSGYTVLQDSADPNYTLVENDLGSRIAVRVHGMVWRADQATTIAHRERTVLTARIESAPSNDRTPSIAGAGVVGGQLQADPGAWHGGGGALEFQYQWQRCDDITQDCDDIPNATLSTYTPNLADVEHALRVRVTAANGSTTGTADSALIGPIGAAEPLTNSEPPTLSGAPVERQALTAHAGMWEGTEPIRYEHRWQVCDEFASSCEDIPGATSDSFEPQATEVARQLRVVVSASNGAGTVEAASDLSEPVQPAPAPTSSEPPGLTLLGSATPQSVVTTDGGQWQNAGDEHLGFRWQRCDASGDDCVDIPGADLRSYEITASDVGSRLRVQVAAVSASGDASTTSELSPVIAPAGQTLVGSMVFVNDDRDTLFAAAADGSNVRAITTCTSLTGAPTGECELHAPRISPSGKMIAVHSERWHWTGTERRVFVMNAEGTGARAVAEGADPAWTTDPSELLVSLTPNDDAGASHIYRIRLDQAGDAAPQQVTATDGQQSSPDLSPDGTKLAYTQKTAANGSASLYVADADGSNPERLDLNLQFSDVRFPMFTADGNQILFTVYGTFDVPQIFAINADGSHLHRVTQTGSYPGPASYDPGQDAIITTWRDPSGCPSTSGLGCEVVGWDGSGPYTAWTIDRDGNRGHPLFPEPNPGGERDVSSHRVMESSVTDEEQDLAERIRTEQGLRELEWYANNAQNAAKRTAAQALRSALGPAIKVASKASIITTIGFFILDDGDLDCGAGPFNRSAKQAFGDAGIVLEQVSGASRGFHPRLVRDVRSSQHVLRGLRLDAQDSLDNTNQNCKPYYRVARDVVDQLQPALTQADRRLSVLHRQAVQSKVLKIQRRSPSGPVGTRNCDQARELVDALGRGANRRNHVVYWSPAYPSVVRYVGRSRALDSRCSNYRNRDPGRHGNLETLNLPPLTLAEARAVEEALIAHYGPFSEVPTVSKPGRLSGQLTNQRHEIDPNRWEYCNHLLTGQYILRLNPSYDPPHARAYFTRGKRCPGVGPVQ